jgi:WXG100 family type VII secretion target
MSEIMLKADEARDQAAGVRRASEDAAQSIEQLRSRLSSLEDSFRGQTSQRFQQKYDEWEKGAKQMLDGLDGLGDFLNKAADTIEQADAEIAGQLG